MDTARLAAIRAREQAATPGPWVWARDYCMADGRHWCLENPGCRERTVNWRTVLLETHETDFSGMPLDQTPDLVFIAAARADVPDLLAEVERLQAVRPQIEAEIARLTAENERLVTSDTMISIWARRSVLHWVLRLLKGEQE